LYRVGAIGVKLKNGNRFMYSHLDEALLPIAQFTEDARIRIHPMLWGAFRLQADRRSSESSQIIGAPMG
jgi:hypothetical protein